MNGRLLYDSLLEHATIGLDYMGIWASSSVYFAYSNPLVYNHHCFYQFGASGGNEYMDFSFGTALEAKGAGIIDHNAYTKGVSTIKIQVGSVDDGATWDIDVATITVTGNAWTEPHVATKFATAYTRQHWRVHFSSASGSLRFGTLYLATSVLDFPETPDKPYRPAFSGQVVTDRRQSGGRIVHPYGGVLGVRQLRWASLSETNMQNLQDVLDTQHGSARPLVYCEYSNTYSDTGPMRYVRLLGLTFGEHAPGGFYDVRLTVEDCP